MRQYVAESVPDGSVQYEVRFNVGHDGTEYRTMSVSTVRYDVVRTEYGTTVSVRHGMGQYGTQNSTKWVSVVQYGMSQYGSVGVWASMLLLRLDVLPPRILKVGC